MKIDDKWRWTLINACSTAKMKYDDNANQLLQMGWPQRDLGRNPYQDLANQFHDQADQMEKLIQELQEAPDDDD